MQSPRDDIGRTLDQKLDNARLVESLDRIDKHIESLAETKKTSTGILTSGSGIALPKEEEYSIKESEVPISGLFLAKIMPDVAPKKIENS